MNKTFSAKEINDVVSFLERLCGALPEQFRSSPDLPERRVAFLPKEWGIWLMLLCE